MTRKRRLVTDPDLIEHAEHPTQRATPSAAKQPRRLAPTHVCLGGLRKPWGR